MVSAGLLGRAVTRQRRRARDKGSRYEGAAWGRCECVRARWGGDREGMREREADRERGEGETEKETKERQGGAREGEAEREKHREAEPPKHRWTQQRHLETENCGDIHLLAPAVRDRPVSKTDTMPTPGTHGPRDRN